MTKYKLALISPGKEGSVVSGRWKGLVNFYRLTLPLLAGLTDRNKYEISVFDECVDSYVPTSGFDLVAMSVMTPYAPRAYELSQQFMAKGAKVVIGGKHATLLPQEAEQFVDAVALGSAELTWPQILQDFESGQLKKRYEAPAGLGRGAYGWVRPDRSIMRQKSLMVFSTAETSYGCPYTCSYCVIAAEVDAIKFKDRYEYFPIDHIVADIAALPGKFVFFVDDDFIGSSGLHRERTKEVLRAIAPLKKKCFAQVTVQFGDDEELLDIAAEAGIVGVYIGFESLINESLQSVHKAWNKPGSYLNRIQKIRDRGITVEAGFIFGMDGDTPDVFDITAEFVHRSGIESPNAHILTPHPGTPLYVQLQREKRIFTYDWSLYNTGHVVFHPAKMTIDQLETGYERWYREMFSPATIMKRVAKSNFWYYSALMNLAKGLEVRRQFGMK